MAISSSAVAVVPGTTSPSIDLWITVRLVEKPSAPARTPSSTISAIFAMSSWVGIAPGFSRSPST